MVIAASSLVRSSVEEEEEAQLCLSAPGVGSGRGSEREGRGEGRGSEGSDVKCDNGLECQCEGVR